MKTNIGQLIYIAGAVFVLAVAGIIALVVREQTIPDVLQNIAVGSMTLLGGLLVQPSEPTS